MQGSQGRLPFTKMQGVGNDFVLIDARDLSADWSRIAPALCARRTGIGADGLLVVRSSMRADLLMEMYNPDGSPDVCGNGLRCVALYAAAQGIVHTDRMLIETFIDVRAAIILRRVDGQRASISVGMGLPQFEPDRIPMRVDHAPVIDYPLPLAGGETLRITALSTGSTHAVTFVDALPDDTRFQAVSLQVENHPLFPERTSLMWCHVLARNSIEIRIWERGAGETLGCGTGACAAAVGAILHRYADPGAEVTVASRGGVLSVRWTAGEPILMSGPAGFVFEGSIDVDM